MGHLDQPGAEQASDAGKEQLPQALKELLEKTRSGDFRGPYHTETAIKSGQVSRETVDAFVATSEYAEAYKEGMVAALKAGHADFLLQVLIQETNYAPQYSGAGLAEFHKSDEVRSAAAEGGFDPNDLATWKPRLSAENWPDYKGYYGE
jgi:hypothetical protein